MLQKMEMKELESVLLKNSQGSLKVPQEFLLS